MTMMNKVILYRDLGLSTDKIECDAAIAAGFEIKKNRTAIKPNEFVIPRYSSLPYYKELEDDVNLLGSKLINSFYQHNYIADLQNYVFDLAEFTPLTWSSLEDLPDEGPFILKGQTNSRKDCWKTHMFAENKQAAYEVYNNLQKDSLIGQQHIYIRKFVPLKKYMDNVVGMPITNEFRIFVCFGQIISKGYYHSSHLEELSIKPDPESIPNEFLQKVISKIGNKSNFYTVDVAETAEGEWIVIEMNCGSMSGLSDNNPQILYKNLAVQCDKYIEEKLWK